MSKKERINNVFSYLRQHGYIHTQGDLADAIGSTRPNISKMLKGDPKVLTNSICIRIHNTFKIISAEWLINGTGEMIIKDSNNIATEQHPVPDYSSLINATIAAMNSTIASLKRELASNNASNKAALEAKDDTIASLKRELEAKDALVKLLKQQMSDFGFGLSDGYPFPMGVAEDGGTVSINKESKTSTKFPSSRKQ